MSLFSTSSSDMRNNRGVRVRVIGRRDRIPRQKLQPVQIGRNQDYAQVGQDGSMNGNNLQFFQFNGFLTPSPNSSSFNAFPFSPNFLPPSAFHPVL